MLPGESEILMNTFGEVMVEDEVTHTLVGTIE